MNKKHCVCLCLSVLLDIVQLCHYAILRWQFKEQFVQKDKTFLEAQIFSNADLKKCYCDARYLGKSFGDPLKIVQNESVTKKNTYWSTL